MVYKVQPILYAVNDEHKSTIRFTVDFLDDIEPDALAYAVEQVGKRYPYFKVRLERQGEEFVLADNEQPFVISEKNAAICLGSSQSNFHLLAFAYEKNMISIDVSHNICDGNGIAPLIKTLFYYYIERRYGLEGVEPGVVRLVTDAISEDEYLYPFPEEPFDVDEALFQTPKKVDPLVFGTDFFDSDGAYAYNLKVSQSEFMTKAKACDGSPVSLFTVMLYRTLISLFPNNNRDMVFLIPHEYRKTLGKPVAHDSLIRVMSACLPARVKDDSVKNLNMILREQMLDGCDEINDIKVINSIIQLDSHLKTLPLEAKMKKMQELVTGVMDKQHTCFISYTGNVLWGGMEKYIRDVHVYAGEKKRHDISVEIFTCGDHFSICFMQPGKNPAIVDELVKCMEESGITCELTSEGYFDLPDFTLPQIKEQSH